MRYSDCKFVKHFDVLTYCLSLYFNDGRLDRKSQSKKPEVIMHSCFLRDTKNKFVKLIIQIKRSKVINRKKYNICLFFNNFSLWYISARGYVVHFALQIVWPIQSNSKSKFIIAVPLPIPPLLKKPFFCVNLNFLMRAEVLHQYLLKDFLNNFYFIIEF